MVITALQEKNVRYKITDTYQLPADFQVNPNFPEGNYLKDLFTKLKNNFLHQAKVPAPLIGIGTFCLVFIYSNFWAFWVFAKCSFA